MQAGRQRSKNASANNLGVKTSLYIKLWPNTRCNDRTTDQTMNIRPIIISIISLLIFSLGAEAAIKITGRVTDEENEPLEFVSVRVSGTALGATTGLDGKFSLSCAETDTLRLVFSCIGYKESRRRFIDPKGELTVNVKMEPETYTLQSVQVTDYQKQTGSMQKIDMDSYRIAPDVSGNGVESLITTMAGVAGANEMSSQYSVRGGSFDENSVRINGVEVYRPQLISSGQQEGLSIINPDMVGAVGFSTGGFPAQYGDRMSSVLDITYREPESFEGSVNLSLQGGGITLGTSSRRFSQLHGVRYKSNSSLLSSMDEKGEYDPRFFDYQTLMTLRLSDKWKLQALGNIAVNNYKFIPRDRETNFGTATDAKQFKVYFDGSEKDRFETFFGSLNLSYRPNRKSEYTLLASGFLSNELVAYDISGEYWLDQAGTSGGGSTGGAIGGELGVGRYHEHARNRLKAEVFTLSLRGANGVGRHNIAYGLDLSSERIRDRSREWELRDSAGYSLPTAPDALKVIYNLDSRENISSTRFSAYVQDTYRLQTSAGYLSLNGGVRLSWWSYNKELLVSPRINIGFVPDAAPRWAFRFATGLYYQSPFYKEFRQPITDPVTGNTVIRLNDKIKSQRSYQIILGADFTFKAFDRPFKLSGEAYCKLLGNLVPYEIENLKIVYSGENSTKGSAIGLDMKLYGQFVPGSDSWISFSLMKSQETLNGVKVPRPSDRRYGVAAYFTDYFPKLPRLKFSLRGIFNDGLPVTPPRSSRDKGYFRTPAYKRLDVGLSYGLVTEPAPGQPRNSLQKIIKSAWLGLDCFNLLDISNVSSYYWVTDVNNIQYAVPTYLTRRQLNVRLSVTF